MEASNAKGKREIQWGSYVTTGPAGPFQWCMGSGARGYTQAPPTRPGDVAGVFTDEPGGVGK